MVQIKLAQLEDIDSIVGILNEVTLNLHKKGINQWTYPWDSSEVRHDIEYKHVYLLIVEGVIIGTFSIKDMDNVAFEFIEPESKYLNRIAILPEYQGKNLGSYVVNYSIDYSKRIHKQLYLDCWAGNERLRSFYLNTGFEFVGNFPEEDYMISVFKAKNI